MTDKESLEVDFQMYDGAVKDLEKHGGDEQTISKLQRKRDNIGQALNMLRKTVSPSKSGRYFLGQ